MQLLNFSVDNFKVGLGISQTNADSQRNPVYNAFHRNFVVETKRFVGSTVHVILERQTCDQRSSRAAKSKHWALLFFPSEFAICPVSFPQQKNWIRCVVNWISLRIRTRSRNTQAHLKISGEKTKSLLSSRKSQFEQKIGQQNQSIGYTF